MSHKSLLLVLAGLLAAPAARAQNCTPNRMMLVLDRSSTMMDSLGGMTKWDATKMAVSSLASKYSSKIELGLELFPDAATNKCSTSASVYLQPALNQGAAINSSMTSHPPIKPGAWTPLYQAIDLAAAQAKMLDKTRKPNIIVMTDGWQCCYVFADPNVCAEGTYGSKPIDSVKAAKAKGIKVHVVGFGSGVDVVTLNKMAYEAGTAKPGCDTSQWAKAGNCYWQVNDQAALASVMDDITVKATAEECDGIDNNCDGQIDEGLYRACTNSCGAMGQEHCEKGAWVGCNAQACDMAVKPRDMAVGPDMVEPLDLTIPWDFTPGPDFTVEPDLTLPPDMAIGPDLLPEAECKDGDTRACGSDVGECIHGIQRCENGKWARECEGGREPSIEVCNGKDDDCDGVNDNAGEQELCPEGQECKLGKCRTSSTASKDLGNGLGTDDAGTGGQEPEGCGCRLGGAQGDLPTAALLLLLPLGVFVARRRRS